MNSPIYNPGQPHLLPIPGGLTQGCIIHISGTFSPNATSIVLKLQSGNIGDPNDNVGLCIYGRCVENVVGCNSFSRNEGWGIEATVSTQSLIRGQPIEFAILCEPHVFKIAVNRQHLTEFSHRVNPSFLNHLNVASGSNDITLNCLWIEMPHMPQRGPPSVAAVPQYQHKPSNSNKGLLGMVGTAGAAVAGALGASKTKSYQNHGGFPSHSGFPSLGGHSSQGAYPGGYHGSHKSSSGGGMLNKALALGGGILAAKTAKGVIGSGSKGMKYGLPLAGAGLGGYMLTKGVSKGFHCGGSSSSSGSCSSEEEE